MAANDEGITEDPGASVPVSDIQSTETDNGSSEAILDQNSKCGWSIPESLRDELEDKQKTLDDKLYSELVGILSSISNTESQFSTNAYAAVVDEKVETIYTILTTDSHSESPIPIFVKALFDTTAENAGESGLTSSTARLVKAISAKLENGDQLLLRMSVVNHFYKQFQRDDQLEPSMWGQKVGAVYFLAELYVLGYLTSRVLLDFIDNTLGETRGGWDEVDLHCLAILLLTAGKELESYFNNVVSKMEVLSGKGTVESTRNSRIYEKMTQITNGTNISDFTRNILSNVCELREGNWDDEKRRSLTQSLLNDGPMHYLDSIKLKEMPGNPTTPSVPENGGVAPKTFAPESGKTTGEQASRSDKRGGVSNGSEWIFRGKTPSATSFPEDGDSIVPVFESSNNSCLLPAPPKSLPNLGIIMSSFPSTSFSAPPQVVTTTSEVPTPSSSVPAPFPVTRNPFACSTPLIPSIYSCPPPTSTTFSSTNTTYVPPAKKICVRSSSPQPSTSTFQQEPPKGTKASTSCLPAALSVPPSNPELPTLPPTAPANTTQSPPLASTPVPPNWCCSYTEAMQSLTPYYASPVAPDSMEYHVLSLLVEQTVRITQIHRVVNIELWRRFVSTRKDLLSCKSSDLNLLQSLGLQEDEILHRYHVNLNFTQDPAVATVEYSDNMALLFHCTKAKGVIEDILTQGLDDRLGSAGTLGSGIYFTDDPSKAISYDGNSTLLVFGVLLGDCAHHESGGVGLRREPQKSKEQKRNHLDLFFDSIVGRNGSHGKNEYVIFNRNQCCPLYAINYAWGASPHPATAPVDPYHALLSDFAKDAIAKARFGLPAFAWVSSDGGVARPRPSPAEWPFHAHLLFGSMRGANEPPSVPPARPVQAPLNALANEVVKGVEVVMPIKRQDQETQLQQLQDLGFGDRELNMILLKNFQYDLEATLDCLLDGTASTANVDDVAGATTVTGNADLATSSRVDPEETDLCACTICCNEYPPGPASWKTLPCKDKLCIPCYASIQLTRTTMGGEIRSSVKCPFCNASTGIQIGSCPDGEMVVTEIHRRTPGYGGASTFQIKYSVPGYHSRTAYIPNWGEGEKVVELLKIAWDRRLVFAIGTSGTTGAKNTLVWNIHHKTALDGGLLSYGYPDPTYLKRVIDELAQYGIE